MVISPNNSVIIKESAGICRITFNRPKMLNAINFDMVIALSHTKALLNSSFQRTLDEQLNAEIKSFSDCAITQYFSGCVTAFTNKRSAQFVRN